MIYQMVPLSMTLNDP